MYFYVPTVHILLIDVAHYELMSFIMKFKAEFFWFKESVNVCHNPHVTSQNQELIKEIWLFYIRVSLELKLSFFE